MTVIAYRGGVLAADSLMVMGGHVNHVRSLKVVRRQGHLIGMRGEACPTMAEAADWIFKKTKGRFDFQRGYVKPFRFWDTREEMVHAYAFTLMLVTPTGEIFEIDQAGGVEPIPCGHHAIGSGAEFALAVMDYDRKADAITAVRAGIRRSAFCRPPIYWYGLDGKQGEIKE
ncbi:MAG TPA: hypothetical protein VEA41_13855 [Salinarimonas sp.]|nr:hypothetical protein [Salinarimonas sp.]